MKWTWRKRLLQFQSSCAGYLKGGFRKRRWILTNAVTGRGIQKESAIVSLREGLGGRSKPDLKREAVLIPDPQENPILTSDVRFVSSQAQLSRGFFSDGLVQEIGNRRAPSYQQVFRSVSGDGLI